MKYIKCEMCGYKNHEDNFKCEGEDCGIPLDLVITNNSFGLPEIITKNPVIAGIDFSESLTQLNDL